MPKWLGQSPFFYTHTSATSIVDGGFHTSQMTSSEPFVMCCLFQASFSPRGTVSLSLPDTVMISSPFKPGKPASTQASLQSSQLLKMMLLYCPRPGAQRSERYLTPFFWLHKHAERPVATQSGGSTTSRLFAVCCRGRRSHPFSSHQSETLGSARTVLWPHNCHYLWMSP